MAIFISSSYGAEVYLLSSHIMPGISWQKHTPKQFLHVDVRQKYSHTCVHTIHQWSTTKQSSPRYYCKDDGRISHIVNIKFENQCINGRGIDPSTSGIFWTPYENVNRTIIIMNKLGTENVFFNGCTHGDIYTYSKKEETIRLRYMIVQSTWYMKRLL